MPSFFDTPELPAIRFRAMSELAPNTNLNGLHSPGFYYIDGPVNGPDIGAYFLTIFAAPTPVRPAGVYQETISLADATKKSRINVGGTWTDWS